MIKPIIGLARPNRTVRNLATLFNCPGMILEKMAMILRTEKHVSFGYFSQLHIFLYQHTYNLQPHVGLPERMYRRRPGTYLRTSWYLYLLTYLQYSLRT